MLGHDFIEIEGSHDAKGLRLGCVVSRFNNYVTDRLLDGALDAIQDNGGDTKDVVVVRVPGSLELATAARALAQKGKAAKKPFDALICLGAVIRGETDHYEHVSTGALNSITQLGTDAELEIPTVFGVLTCETARQALDRAGGKAGNAGSNAAVTAIEMASVLKKIRGL